jgi:hypothetical protein
MFSFGVAFNSKCACSVFVQIHWERQRETMTLLAFMIAQGRASRPINSPEHGTKRQALKSSNRGFFRQREKQVKTMGCESNNFV